MQLFSAENFRFLLIYISMEKFKKKFGLCIFRALDLMIAKNVLLECFVEMFCCQWIFFYFNKNGGKHVRCNSVNRRQS